MSSVLTPRSATREPSSHDLKSALSTRYTIADGCKMINRHLEGIDERGKDLEFHAFFPRFLEKLFGFGKDSPRSWIEEAQYDNKDVNALVNLLSPDGLLFKALLAHRNNRSFSYEFPVGKLPKPTQRLLESNQALPPIYTHKLRQRPASAPGFPSTGDKDQYFLELSILEYYFFCFAMYPIYGSGAREPSSRSSSHRSSSANVGWNFVKEKLGPSSSSSGDIYTMVTMAYMNKFLSPLNGTGEFGSPRAVERRPSLLGRGLSSRSVSVVTKPYPPALAVQLRDLFFGVLNEFWLNQNAYPESPAPLPVDGMMGGLGGTPSRPYESHAYGSPNPTGMPEAGYGALGVYHPQPVVEAFVCPSKALLTTLRHVVAHVHVVAARYKGDSTDVSAGTEAQSVLRTSHYLTVHLYRFLRLAFTRWPVDSRLPMEPLVDVWLTYLQPWSCVGDALEPASKYSGSPDKGGMASPLARVPSLTRSTTHDVAWDEWEPFLAPNFLFYSQLFSDLIDKLAQLSLESSNLEKRVYEDLWALEKAIRFYGKERGLLGRLQRLDSEAGRESGMERRFSRASSLTRWFHELELPDYKYGGYFSTPSGTTQRMVQVLVNKGHRPSSTKDSSQGSTSKRLSRMADYMCEIFGLDRNTFHAPYAPLEREDEPEQKVDFLDKNVTAREKLSMARHKRQAVKIGYEGDALVAPICSSEVAFLVRILVPLNYWLQGELVRRGHISADTRLNLRILASYPVVVAVCGMLGVLYLWTR